LCKTKLDQSTTAMEERPQRADFAPSLKIRDGVAPGLLPSWRSFMTAMRILVTGGAGFIGSQIARRLLAEGHEVVIIDNLFTGTRRNVPLAAVFIEGDIGRGETIASIPDLPFDAVCHLAAQSSGAVSMEQPLYDIQTNAVSTLLLTRWCQQRGVRRFIYASSMAVYGNPVDLPVGEDAPLVPLSYYGVSKLASEHLLRLASRSIAVTALRMFNVYGPGQNMANLRQGMASIYLAYILKGGEVPVTGSLDRFRDFVYIDDVVEAWINVLLRPSTPSLAYNIGSGTGTTVRDLLRFLIAACNLPPDHPVRELPAPAGDQFGLTADARRAADELGWKARMPVDEGMRRMVAWARSEIHG
jgi:UDP-glucose 4-epimerase